MTTRTVSIVASSTFALLLVGGSYLAATPGGILVALHIANAQSSEEVLRAYAIKDTDGDLLPDWQEALYGTDPENPSSVKAGITDGEAVAQGLVKPKVSSVIATTETEPSFVPGETPASNTLTDQFSQEFFQAYIQASGGQAMSAEDQQALVTRLLGNFSTKAQTLIESPYTLTSVHTSNTVSVLSYADSVEKTIKKNETPGVDTGVVNLADSLINGSDEAARTKLKKLTTAYGAIASQLALLSVPPALAQDHLRLMQSFDTSARATALVVSYEKDPVAVLGAISAYPSAADALIVAFKNIGNAILQGGEPLEGEPGSFILHIVHSTASQ